MPKQTQTAQNQNHREPDTPTAPLEQLQLSMILEPPALSYALSEVRLFSRLLTAEPEEFGVDFKELLGAPALQQVLNGSAAYAKINPREKTVAGMRYLAHIYNAALGTDFTVHVSPSTTSFFSDGAVRRLLEDLQEKDKLTLPLKARLWSERELFQFLQALPERPHLERFLLNAKPESTLGSLPINQTRARALYVQDIVIPTANRPGDVMRLLRSLQNNLKFYGYHPSTITVQIFDTSTDISQRAETWRAAQLAKSQGLNVQYFDRGDIRSKLKPMRDGLGKNACKAFNTVFLRGLFSKNESDGQPLTIGTIRNAISFFMGDRPYLSLDDDMMLHSPIPGFAEYGTRLTDCRSRPMTIDPHVGAATDYVRSDYIPSHDLPDKLLWIPTDIIGIANRKLDTPLYVTESRIVGARTDTPFTKGEARISVVRPYLAGASPDVTLYLRRFMNTSDVRELSGEKADYCLPVEVAASVLHRGYSSGTMFATSAGLSAPFLDGRAYEDVAQSHLAEFLFGNNMQFQGSVIEHRRHVGPRIINSAQYIDVLLGYHMMIQYTSDLFPNSFISGSLSKAPNRVEAFRALGRQLWKDASKGAPAERQLQSLVDGYLTMGKALRACRVSGADSFLIDRAAATEALKTRYQVLQRLNGLLYFYWPDFVKAVSRSGDLS